MARTLSILALAAFGIAAPLSAQQADVIRGQVLTDKGVPIEKADVTVTSIPSNIKKVTTVGKGGRYTVTFANGEGDYWISVVSMGYSARRFELKRVADEAILVGDIVLTSTGVVLDAVKVQADRARTSRTDAADVSGTEKTLGALSVDPGEAGNLAAMAASLPGVQLIPGADGNPDQFSVYGLSGDQNNATLNGFAFGGGDIPRDAGTRSALATSPWDVSRGGFSGAQFGIRTQSGSNFSSRGVSTLLNTPGFQWTDRAGRSSGAQYSSASVGASTTGPIVIDRAFYSGGYQVDRRSSDIQSLTNADRFALTTAGLAPDSANRFRNILSGAGVPLAIPGLPASRTNDRALALLSVDVAPPTSTSGQSLNITASGNYTKLAAPFGQVTALPTTDGTNTNLSGSLQARHTNYFGFGVLTETSVGLTRASTKGSAYAALPGGVVRVGSSLDDGSTAISQLSFGGSAAQRTSTVTTTIGGQNQLSWFSLDNRHRIKLTSELRAESFAQDLSTNRLGTFAYNSLDDLAAGTPVSFTRLLSPRLRKGRQLTGAMSLGDSYRVSSDLQLQYGARVDVNRFLDRPRANDLVAQILSADNSGAPNGTYVSPRIGFSWTYGQAAQLAAASGFMRGPRAVVRGGIGLFQNTPATQSIGAALTATGLSGAEQQISCVGAAVPAPDWAAYLRSSDAIPTTCAGGAPSLQSSAPNVVLFAPSFRAPRSARANLNWSGAVLGSRFTSTVDGTFSLNLDQPGMSDLNFNSTQRFALSNEGNRPVYAPSSSIVAATGAVSPQAARASTAFSRVTQIGSSLRSTNRQLSIAIRPLTFSSSFGWNLTYVYSNTRERYSGFASAASNPLVDEWSRASLDSRHQFVYTLSYNLLDWFPISLSGSIRSGRPFTPMVAGDINGDGYMNDRAFVFDPSTVDPSIAPAMQTLLTSGSANARDCLHRQLGTVAERNSCQAPWNSTSSLVVSVNPLKLRLPQRVNVTLFVNNAFGAADLLLHGENGRHGWGQSADPDQTLLFVRGFNPSTQRFTYEVNQRFGATNVAQTLARNPVVVTAQVRIDVGFTRERQLLSQSLDRGRIQPGPKPTDSELRNLGGTLLPANPMLVIIQSADALKLTRDQADSIATLNREYVIALDSIWSPVGTYLAGLPADYSRGDAYDRFRQARRASVDALMRLVPAVRSQLDARQIRLLPATAASSLDGRYLASVRSSTAGNANIGVLGMLAQMNGALNADASGAARTIMVHR